MAMMYAGYFDASGKKYSNKFVTVAGAVAPVKKWKRFADDWATVLKREMVSGFHATDFASSLGEYTGWKGDKERRAKFLSDLGALVKRDANKLFAVTVEMDAWNQVNAKYQLKEHLKSPYALAGSAGVLLIRKWARGKAIKTPIKYIFEDGDEVPDWSGLKILCSKMHVEPIRLPKDDAIPCQIGDMVGWKVRIAAQNTERINSRIDPAAYDSKLLKDVLDELHSLSKVMVRPVDNKIFSEKRLVNTCIANKVPLR
jgi:hypothetical protein